LVTGETELVRNARALFASDPIYRNAFEAADHEAYFAVYGSIMKRLGIDFATYKRLVPLLDAKRNIEIDTAQVAFENGLRRGTPEFQAAIDQAETSLNNEITSAIGPEKASLLDQIPKEMEAENRVRTTYAAAFDAAGVPLSDVQENQLASVLSGSSPSASELPVPENQFLTQSDQAFLSKAGNSLSPEQLNALRNSILNTNILRYYKRTKPKSVPWEIK
jgi:hypothetical protein